ncbi:hypothetical protein FQR65_LT11933 [Abscondita terminalis]|nr:hypothetical protein FQR65_LT11933 [Abscondita terminalis]
MAAARSVVFDELGEISSDDLSPSDSAEPLHIGKFSKMGSRDPQQWLKWLKEIEDERHDLVAESDADDNEQDEVNNSEHESDTEQENDKNVKNGENDNNDENEENVPPIHTASFQNDNLKPAGLMVFFGPFPRQVAAKNGLLSSKTVPPDVSDVRCCGSLCRSLATKLHDVLLAIIRCKSFGKLCSVVGLNVSVRRVSPTPYQVPCQAQPNVSLGTDHNELEAVQNFVSLPQDIIEPEPSTSSNQTSFEILLASLPKNKRLNNLKIYNKREREYMFWCRAYYDISLSKIEENKMKSIKENSKGNKRRKTKKEEGKNKNKKEGTSKSIQEHINDEYETQTTYGTRRGKDKQATKKMKFDRPPISDNDDSRIFRR